MTNRFIFWKSLYQGAVSIALGQPKRTDLEQPLSDLSPIIARTCKNDALCHSSGPTHSMKCSNTMRSASKMGAAHVAALLRSFISHAAHRPKHTVRAAETKGGGQIPYFTEATLSLMTSWGLSTRSTGSTAGFARRRIIRPTACIDSSPTFCSIEVSAGSNSASAALLS